MNGKADPAVTVRVPAFVHLTTDGALPRTPPGSGIDTRDEIIDYASIAGFAETTRIQGQSLYPEIQERLRHALGFRLGIPMTNTQWYTESRRPQGTNNLFVSWQTLTHAQNPA